MSKIFGGFADTPRVWKDYPEKHLPVYFYSLISEMVSEKLNSGLILDVYWLQLFVILQMNLGLWSGTNILFFFLIP